MSDGNAAFTAIGVAGIGMGALLIYSAYAKVPLFGSDGLLTAIIQRGNIVEGAGEAVGKAAGKGAKKGAEIIGSATPAPSPPPIWT